MKEKYGYLGIDNTRTSIETESEEYTSYFTCYRRDGEKEYFNERCNYINAVFDSNAIAFIEKNEVSKEGVILAIIPIDNIAAIMRYEK